MKIPDYENGLVNLSNSILRNFGARQRHPSLPWLDKTLDKGFQTVVLMLLDGMGTDALTRHLPKNNFLCRHQEHVISSVFPPTTTAALTSIETGLTPMEHGWLGWSLYFKEPDQIVELFHNTIRESGGVQAADYHVAHRMMPVETIDEDIAKAGIGVMHTVSPYAGHRVTTLDELFETVQRLCAKPGRNFVYAYWNQPDALMHSTGCGSLQVRDTIRALDQGVEALCQSLKDTLIIVTADHGHINTRYQFISAYPDLLSTILRPPAIEGRAAAFYVKEGCMDTFPKLFSKAFGEHFVLFTKDEVIQKGLFGNGTPHACFKESIGDFLAVAVSDVVIANSPASRQFISNHGGMTSQEMDVPLIVIET